MGEITRRDEPETIVAPEDNLSAKQPVAHGRASISEERKGDLRKVFSDFTLTREGADGKQESISFTPGEVEMLIGDDRVQEYPPETLKLILPSRFIENVSKLHVAFSTWKQAILDYPQIIIQKPDTTNNNIEESARLLGIGKEVFVNAALKHSQLFAQKPETINNNVEESARLLGIGKEVFF
jgi:hypothetical protein